MTDEAMIQAMIRNLGLAIEKNQYYLNARYSPERPRIELGIIAYWWNEADQIWYGYEPKRLWAEYTHVGYTSMFTVVVKAAARAEIFRGKLVVLEGDDFPDHLARIISIEGSHVTVVLTHPDGRQICGLKQRCCQWPNPGPPLPPSPRVRVDKSGADVMTDEEMRDTIGWPNCVSDYYKDGRYSPENPPVMLGNVTYWWREKDQVWKGYGI